MTIGENIKRIRTEKNLTQKQLGDLCGMADSAIRRYELGKANPKIETVEKIAKALGVLIIDIMENFTLEQYKTTEEYKQTLKEIDALEGIIAILKEIYGDVIEKYVSEEYGDSFYYLVGTRNDTFILYEDDIRQLFNYVKSSIPFVVDGLKDTRTEQEVIDEIKADLNDPAYVEQIKKHIAEQEEPPAE